MLLHSGDCLEFGDTVLHFLPDEPLPSSLYRAGGVDCNDVLPLPEFRAAIEECLNLAAKLGQRQTKDT